MMLQHFGAFFRVFITHDATGILSHKICLVNSTLLFSLKSSSSFTVHTSLSSIQHVSWWNILVVPITQLCLPVRIHVGCQSTTSVYQYHLTFSTVWRFLVHPSTVNYTRYSVHTHQCLIQPSYFRRLRYQERMELAFRHSIVNILKTDSASF